MIELGCVDESPSEAQSVSSMEEAIVSLFRKIINEGHEEEVYLHHSTCPHGLSFQGTQDTSKECVCTPYVLKSGDPKTNAEIADGLR